MDWYPQLDKCNLTGVENTCIHCQKCDLRKSAKHTVFSKGNPEAVLMFVGEAPGADEDDAGVPFVGRSGQLLDKIINAAGINKKDIYITNIVKCRPPKNRTPTKSEADACAPYLTRQIELIVPKVIVCLGAFATQRLIHPDAKVTHIHGRIFTKGPIKIVSTFHPAALLRNSNRKKPCWDDFKTIKKMYDSFLKKPEQNQDVVGI